MEPSPSVALALLRVRSARYEQDAPGRGGPTCGGMEVIRHGERQWIRSHPRPRDEQEGAHPDGAAVQRRGLRPLPGPLGAGPAARDRPLDLGVRLAASRTPGPGRLDRGVQPLALLSEGPPQALTRRPATIPAAH